MRSHKPGELGSTGTGPSGGMLAKIAMFLRDKVHDLIVRTHK